MTIKTHGRMFTDDTVGITQLALSDGTENQAIVTDGAGTLRFATVGAGGSVGSSVYVEDIRTGDGSTATFTLSTGAPYEESILVFIDGVAQPTSSFVLPSTTSITFSPAPGNGAAIRICHLGIASSLADCAVTGSKICMGSDAAGDILFYNGTTYQRLGIGTALQVLITNAAVNAVEWVDAATAALPAVGADGNVLTSDGTNWNSETPLGGVGGEIVSVQTFAFTTVNAQQTWTRPSGVKRIVVHLVGAGGHATGTIGGNQHVGGGGSGGYCMGIYDVTNLATATVEIGCGEDAQDHGGTPAGIAANRDSVFSGTGITTMNAGGGGVAYYLTSVAGGAGGTASGGALNLVGEPGEVGGDPSQTDHYDHARTGGHAGGPFGGTFGRGADGRMEAAVQDGGNGYCIVEEYSDVSASLVGEKLVSTQSFVGSGTWTKPANITKIEVWAVGGGGAASGAGGNPGGGGGGGGTAYSILDVTNLTTGTVVVGGDSSFAGTGITTLTGNTGGPSSSGSSGGGGGASGGNAGNFSGSSGQMDRSGESQFGAYGHGAGPVGSLASGTGTGGIVFIKEYTDASLVSGGSLVPTGVVNPYAGATAPTGWLLCFGQSISRTTYSTLFTAIGTTYGSASGTTFNLPDMRGRAVAGQDDMGGTSANRIAGTTLDGDTLGAVGGDEDMLYIASGASTANQADALQGSAGWTMNQGANLQPTIILNYIIKT